MKYGKYSEQIQFMINSALIGYRIVKNNRHLRVMDKGKFDIVTNLDLEIEAQIIKKLKKEFPDILIVSEEFYSREDFPEKCFVIDPIDGTKNFYHSMPFWGIQMAYIENGSPVASVLYCPELNIDIVAGDDIGVFVNDKRVKYERKDVEHSLILIDGPKEHRWHIVPELDQYVQGIRIIGSTCVGFSFAVSGKTEGYIYMCRHPWDLLPGLCAARNSGLYVYDHNETMALVANSPELLEIMKKSVLGRLAKV